jgi:hypothetical protein
MLLNAVVIIETPPSQFSLAAARISDELYDMVPGTWRVIPPNITTILRRKDRLRSLKQNSVLGMCVTRAFHKGLERAKCVLPMTINNDIVAARSEIPRRPYQPES